MMNGGIIPETVSGDAGRVTEAESCNSWTESGMHSPTVSATRLAVPGKASSEYRKACGAFKGRRMDEAEVHLRNAIDLYPDYSAAYVVLGQVLRSQSKMDEGLAACAKARDLDPGYIAPYLCLAEFAANARDWDKVAELANRALALDPVSNAYALYYAADAGLHLNQLVQSEIQAQAAIKLDTWHKLPELHLVLARIFELEGNVPGQIGELHNYLKMASSVKEAAQAKATLARLEPAPQK
jgi:tetratricopeptide (TPR) repeat protein